MIAWKINKRQECEMKSNMRDGIIKSGFTALMIFTGTAANAASITNIWAVSDTAQVDCGGSAHGMWTNTLNLGASACNDYYSINAGSTFTEYDDGTAVLNATATNPDGYVADISVSFSDYSDTHAGTVKTGGGPELASWYFYESFTGVITIDSVDYTVGILGDTSMQIGDGANDKTSAFGGSTWMSVSGGGYTGGHWDLNLDFTAVPVPAAVWLFGSGLLGLVGVTRRRQV